MVPVDFQRLPALPKRAKESVGLVSLVSFGLSAAGNIQTVQAGLTMVGITWPWWAWFIVGVIAFLWWLLTPTKETERVAVVNNLTATAKGGSSAKNVVGDGNVVDSRIKAAKDGGREG